MRMLAKLSAYYAKRIIKREQGPSQNDNNNKSLPSRNFGFDTSPILINIQYIYCFHNAFVISVKLTALFNYIVFEHK